MGLIFEESPSHGQLIVACANMQDPYNEWTQDHYDQGFTWREGSVAFAIPDPLSCLIEVLQGDEESSIVGDPQRHILVPFTADGGPIEIGALFTPNLITLKAGSYQLSYELFPGVGVDSHGDAFDYLVRFRFVADSDPKFAVIKQDEEMNFTGTIVKIARPT